MNSDKERIYQALRAMRGNATAFSLTGGPLEASDTYQRILSRVIRLQDELAGLRRDLEIVIHQTNSPGDAATTPGDGEQQQSS